ncbi:MAG: energy-coupling factor transporter transmembrane protein EcfT [Streptosporangiales bacterium]|nr:energy-coupling factor transporter transmembrane protein EcfT [Streptosporangiales bacterium]
MAPVAGRETVRVTGSGRLPRGLHPLAWWLWAIGLAAAASRTTNPLLLLLVAAVAALVVVARRGDSPWARAFRVYLTLGLVVIGIRVVFRILFGTSPAGADDVVFRLPSIALPDWAAGIELGGPVHLAGMLAAGYDGLRLAVLLCCVGAANALANPKRALRVLPGALYEIGVAAVVAVTVAPQIIESGQRVLRARRLRGSARRGPAAAVRRVAIPVLQDALDRSLALAAAMDSRGYGRTAGVARSVRRVTSALVIAGLVGLATGAYGLLDGTAPWLLGLPMLTAGVALCCVGLVLGGRRVVRSRYRPDRWRSAEVVVACSGVAAAVLLFVSATVTPETLYPSLDPPVWPQVGIVPLLGVLVALVPAVAAPPPPHPTAAGGAEPRERSEVAVG